MTRQLTSILFYTILLCTTALTAQTTNTIQPEYEAAKKNLDKGNFQEASKQFDKLVQAGFPDPDIYKFRGISRFRLGDYEAAMKDLDKVRQNDPDAQVLGLLGICRYHAHDNEAAKYFLK